MTLAVLLLLAALILFLVSTRKIRQPERFFIWLLGAGLLAFAGWQIVGAQDHYGVLRGIFDASTGSTLGNAFSRNVGSVAHFAPQLIDLFVLAAAGIGLIAAIGFTPGEMLERITRVGIFILFGFMAGAFTALALVAVGLGGQAQPSTYLGYVARDDVLDGDTLRIGDVSIRLIGIDAPELHQTCGGVDDCGELARAHLAALMDDALVQCDRKETRRTNRFTESFGRPLARCWVRRDGQRPIDLGETMIRHGYAIQYRGEESFGYSEAEAEGRGLALMRGCMLRPDLWRNDNDARRAFESSEELAPEMLRGAACFGPPPEDTLAGEDPNAPAEAPAEHAEPAGP